MPYGHRARQRREPCGHGCKTGDDQSPFETTIDGANSIIINFTGGHDMKIKEVNEATSQVREAVSPDADIIFGAVIDENMQDDLIITISPVALGQTVSRPTLRHGQAQSTAPSFSIPQRQTQTGARSAIDDLPGI